MTTGELIDVYLLHKLNVGSTDHQNSLQRRRCTEAIQEVVEEVWDEADWDNKQATTTGTLTATNDSVDAPSNFVTFGEGGGLFIQIGGQWERLEYLDPASLFAERENNRNGNGCPEFYTVSQQDSTYLAQIIFDRVADTTYSLRFYYDSIPPVILDRPLALTAEDSGDAGNPDGIYEYRVVFVGTDGSESEAGAKATVSTDSNIVELTNIPIGSTAVVSRKIYRNENSGLVFKLLTTLDDNTTTTYLDNTADGSLGAEMTATATASSLKRVPESYHRSVLLKGLEAKRLLDEGSALAETKEALYRKELARMKSRRKHGLEDLQRIGEGGLPSFRMH